MTASPQAASEPLRLDDLYREHLEFAWRTARYLGVPAADASDVVHEAFVVVQRRLADFDGRHSARSWIAGITRRVVMHYHRGSARIERRHARADPPADATVAADEAVSRGEAEAFLADFLERLPEKKREAFVLGELEGLTVPEIAHISGDNPNTIHSRLRSARRAFQSSVDRLDAVRRREGG